MITRIRTALRHDEGASAVEYGLLVAAIAAIIVVVVFALGTKVKAAFSSTCSSIGTGQGSGTTGC
jgi:pilus assembly protein Flp/PilA